MVQTYSTGIPMTTVAGALYDGQSAGWFVEVCLKKLCRTYTTPLAFRGSRSSFMKMILLLITAWGGTQDVGISASVTSLLREKD